MVSGVSSSRGFYVCIFPFCEWSLIMRDRRKRGGAGPRLVDLGGRGPGGGGEDEGKSLRQGRFSVLVVLLEFGGP